MNHQPLSLRVIESELSWYFGPGQSCFERSTFGPMLERAMLFAFDSKGQPIPQSPPIELVYAADGETPIATRVALTVRPMQTHQAEEPGYEPNDRDLQRYARVSRRLDRVSDEVFNVLCTYYGNAGDRWAKQDKLESRIFALYPLTRSAREMLSELGDDDHTPRADERLHVQWVLQSMSPDAQRGKRFARSNDQATELLLLAQHKYRNAEPSQDAVLSSILERLRSRRLDRLEELATLALAGRAVA